MKELKDHRCPGLPNKPYSSYCKVCWYPIYTLWMSKEDHNGECHHGCKSADTCPEAINRATFSANLQKAKAAAGIAANA